MTDHSDSIEDAIRANGMSPPNNIKHGEICRFPGKGKEETNRAGWCFLFDDGKGGVFGDYTRNLKITWKKKRVKPMSRDEVEAFSKKAEEARRLVDTERSKTQAVASQKAKEIWDQATPAPVTHPYLQKKGVLPFGIRQTDNKQLVSPLCDCSGMIQSLQFIDENGGKKFLKGGRTKGCFFIVEGDSTNDDAICIAEGYATAASIHQATGYPVTVAFNAGNLKAVSEEIRRDKPDAKIIVCADDDHYTDGNPGIASATEAAIAVDGWLARPNFGQHRKEWGDDDERPEVILTDFNDLHQVLGLDAVRACVENAIKVEMLPNELGQNSKALVSAKQLNDEECELIIQRLAALPEIQYQREKESEAKKLGIKSAALEKMVKEARKIIDSSSCSLFEKVEPWPDSVDGEELLNEIVSTILRFVVCSLVMAQAVALWAVMTWFVVVLKVAPLLFISAAEKRCGKTLLLTLLGLLSNRPILASNISPAALFRAIEAWNPTLLIDEADAFMKDNEELRGIINSGHTRDSAYVIRTVGENFTPTKFNTFGAKAIAGIGHIADTLMDRAIVIELKRKLPGEKVERLRHADPNLFRDLRSKLARFSIDCEEQVRLARPRLPHQLNDRAQDNWEPMIAIADTVGGKWPRIARSAAMKISGATDSSKSVGVELLSDIKDIFDTKLIDRICTADLIDELVKDDENPWATYNRGTPIKPRQVSKKLAGYGITSGTIRIGSMTKKGYKREQFEEAFSRYLNPPVAE